SSNVSFSPFSVEVSQSDASPALKQRVVSAASKGGFFGFKQEEASDVCYQTLGRLKDRNFLSVFRFKTWWSTQWVGRKGSDLQKETQWVMLDVPEVKSCLVPGADGEVRLFAESGSVDSKSCGFDSIAYVHVSDNPYNLMKEAYAAVRVHLNTFKLLEEKELPGLTDKFGWCTWDAFYLTVEAAGIWHGLKDFKDAGVSPRFLIIDDGWQSISIDGSQMTARIYKFEECEKFRKYKEGTMLSPNSPPFDPKRPKNIISKAVELEHAEKAKANAKKAGVEDLAHFEAKIQKYQLELDEMLAEGQEEKSACSGCLCGDSESYGLKALTNDLRRNFNGLDDIYVWHALCGAWGGVRPGATHLNTNIVPCEVSEGLGQTMEDLAVVKIVEGGVGLVHPSQADDFYDSMHSYLASVGITGVKVDVIESLEYLGQRYGGRVELAKAYYKGLTQSLVKNFKGTGLISSMQQCNDFLYLGTKQISIGRVGDDFWCEDPNGDPMGLFWLQGVHMIHCAYNSLWIGQIIQPDWDMFQTAHICAKYHAGSRAICGGPIYVSDSVGAHDFELLKQLVFPDGTVSKCEHFAFPTRDCLFKNPLFDQRTVLKIWNLNKYGGVVGVFNTQGAGWDPEESESGSVHFTDIEWDQKPEFAKMGEAKAYALYLNQAKELHIVSNKLPPFPILIQPSSFELFNFIPIQILGRSTTFAPIGLTNMLNCVGTVVEVEHLDLLGKVKVKGEGEFLAHSSTEPKMVKVNGEDVRFEWCDGQVKTGLKWIEENGGISTLEFHF
uniref:galactinol--sucrose galactosyltransferase n=1 Tax=Kalanchoe fedtschenkoi TaxID=63787 RepID=A0A7N0TSW6_KALFE